MVSNAQIPLIQMAIALFQLSVVSLAIGRQENWEFSFLSPTARGAAKGRLET